MQNQRIVVDARMINMSGIGTYIKNNIRNGLYTDALGNAQEIHAVDPKLNVIAYQEKIYGLKEQMKFPYKKLKTIHPDILHVPHYNVPIFYRGKMIVTVHDLIHLVHPEFLPNKLAYWYARIMIGIAVKKAKMIVTDSENTKKDILKYYKNINPNKIVVIYLGISEDYIHKSRDKVMYLYDQFKIPKDKKIIMYVGNLKPHKNLNRLIEAFAKMKDLENTRLLLVGKAFDTYDLEEVEKKFHVSDKVIHTGKVTDQELVDFYNLSDVFAFPSLYEGFGLPPLEAMACGTPVIASNQSSVPEVLGNAAYYIDPYSVKQITKALEIQLQNPKEKNPLVEKGYRRVQWFRDKKNTDEKLESLMEQVLRK